MFKKCSIHIVFVLLLLTTGCPPALEVEPVDLECPGKGGIEAAVQALRLQQVNLHPVRASAHCVMSWTDPDGKQRDESLDAQLRFVPPVRLYFKGDKFGAIGLGTNEDLFWMMIKPEIDTYWWGSRADSQRCGESLQFNPWHVTEALGMVQVDTTWEFDHQGAYDVLTKIDAGGKIRRRLFIRACDYLIERIEYLDPDTDQSVIVMLGDYTVTESGMPVPSRIKAAHWRNDQPDSSMEIELKGVRRFEMSAEKMDRLFARPDPENFENVYRLTDNCEFIREK